MMNNMATKNSLYFLDNDNIKIEEFLRTKNFTPESAKNISPFEIIKKCCKKIFKELLAYILIFSVIGFIKGDFLDKNFILFFTIAISLLAIIPNFFHLPKMLTLLKNGRPAKGVIVYDSFSSGKALYSNMEFAFITENGQFIKKSGLFNRERMFHMPGHVGTVLYLPNNPDNNWFIDNPQLIMQNLL